MFNREDPFPLIKSFLEVPECDPRRSSLIYVAPVKCAVNFSKVTAEKLNNGDVMFLHCTHWGGSNPLLN